MYNNTPATMQGKSTMHRMSKIIYLFFVCHNEGKGTRDVMHGAHASSVCFHVLGPFLEVVTRVINKRWGDAYQ